jgi:hypothetical protein
MKLPWLRGLAKTRGAFMSTKAGQLLPEFTNDDLNKAKRLSVEESRAELSQKGESLLTEEQLAPLLDRFKAGESCNDIAAMIGVSPLALFVSFCDWDLRQAGY